MHKHVNWKSLKAQRTPPGTLGYPDFFDERHKRKMLELANLKPSDVFYDLGCGDASVLIFAVKEFEVRKAVGFESEPRRKAKARQRVEKEGLSDRIAIEGEMKNADLGGADVILAMHLEEEEDHDRFSKSGIRNGTRLIKHDLALIGFDFEDVDYPFYLVRFPLRRMRTAEQWTAKVMGRSVVSPEDLWHELHYYRYEKRYDMYDIKSFDRILRLRVKAKHRVSSRSDTR